MDEREALIQSIIDSPDDDTPRLVYADWQEEYGDVAHAELIRVQCRLARLSTDDPERGALAAREAELLQRPENEALTQFGNDFVRGMVYEALCFGEDPFDHSGSPLERVLFLGAADFGDSNWPDVAAATRVAMAPWARRLRRIAFHEFMVDAAVVRALASSPHLTNLREVHFSDSATEPAAVADLLLAPSVRGVDTLILQGENGNWDGLGAALARVFADPRGARLRRLSVQALGTANDVAEVLLNTPNLEGRQVCVCTELPWLSPSVQAALQTRFGSGLHVEYSSLSRPDSWI